MKSDTFEVQRLIKLLENTYGGTAWHGPNILTVLGKVNIGNALNNFQDSHNIAELVHHITAWRTFAIKRLEGQEDFEIEEDYNFISFSTIEELEWKTLSNQLADSQDRLLTLLSECTDEQLSKPVAGREYDFYKLLHGIIQHDLYHLGQIILLQKGEF